MELIMAVKNKEVPYVFNVPLMVAGMPTIDGNIYPIQVLNNLVERFTLKPYIIIQEMNPVERKVKQISLSEPWEKKAMGYVTKGVVVNSTLIIQCECKSSREGKILSGLIKNFGVNGIEVFPVGYGTVGKDGIISPDYKLSYVAVEPKKN